MCSSNAWCRALLRPNLYSLSVTRAVHEGSLLSRPSPHAKFALTLPQPFLWILKWRPDSTVASSLSELNGAGMTWDRIATSNLLIWSNTALMSNFRAFDRDTGFLLPPSVDEWLAREAPGALCRGVIEGLDLPAMVRSYRGSGSASYHPAVSSGIRLCDGSVFEPQDGERDLWRRSGRSQGDADIYCLWHCRRPGLRLHHGPLSGRRRRRCSWRSWGVLALHQATLRMTSAAQISVPSITWALNRRGPP